MTKDEALKYIETKGDSKYVVRTEDEDLTFLSNYSKEIEEKVIGPKVREIHDQYDKDVFSITGLKKEQTEKTYDFLKRVIGSYKTDAEKSRLLEKEIEDLKKNGGDKKLLADLEAVRNQYKELEETKNKEITELRTEFDKHKIKSEIMSSMSGMQFKKGIPEAAVKAYTDQVVNDLMATATYQEGKLVFLKPDGTVLRNPHNALNPYTAKELIDEKTKDIRDAGRQNPGGPDLSKEITYEKDDKGKIKKVNLLLPDSVQTKEDLSEFLVKSGILRGTPEYLAAYAEYSPALKRRPI
jgi:hypothetical protein